ncbi:MAG: hypothetical protein JNK65_04370, partial [Deltaproteobacteria bacterium]|nr:hypothetical protein [Deltaproteobacteria bacterium]
MLKKLSIIGGLVLVLSGIQGKSQAQTSSAKLYTPSITSSFKAFFSDPQMLKAISLSTSVKSSDPQMLKASDPQMRKASDPQMLKASDPQMLKASDPQMYPIKDENLSDPQMDLAVNTLLEDESMYTVVKTVVKSDPQMIKA